MKNQSSFPFFRKKISHLPISTPFQPLFICIISYSVHSNHILHVFFLTSAEPSRSLSHSPSKCSSSGYGDGRFSARAAERSKITVGLLLTWFLLLLLKIFVNDCGKVCKYTFLNWEIERIIKVFRCKLILQIFLINKINKERKKERKRKEKAIEITNKVK